MSVNKLNLASTESLPIRSTSYLFEPVVSSRSLPIADSAESLETPSTLPKDLAENAVYGVAAVILLILFSPVLLIISGLILITSGRPIFYRQTRIGKDGSPFKIFKFRTMINGAHSMRDKVKHLNFMSGPFFKVKNDPRLTKLGKFLRKTSLDELPQLLNVVRAEMSLVGPRPMLPEEVLQLDCDDILTVKPGMTGVWQVSGRSQITDFQRKLLLDRYYIRRRSFIFDVKILFRTLIVVGRGKGSC